MNNNRPINLGGARLKMETVGVDEALLKLNTLMHKLEEAKSLIDEIASMNVDIKFGKEDQSIND